MSDQDALPLPELAAMEVQARRARRRRREEEWRRGASTHPRLCTCGASLLWALTTSDPPEWMPLAAIPDPLGLVRVERDGVVPIAVIDRSSSRSGRQWWRPHWRDCPHADQHRRRRS